MGTSYLVIPLRVGRFERLILTLVNQINQRQSCASVVALFGSAPQGALEVDMECQMSVVAVLVGEG